METLGFATDFARTNVTSWLLLWVLKGSLLLALLFPLSALLHRAASSTRHLIWTAGLAIVVLLPVLSALVPWRIALPQSLSSVIVSDVSDAAATPAPASESTEPATLVKIEGAGLDVGVSIATSPQEATSASEATSSSTPSSATSSPSPWTRARVLNVVLLAWLAGAALLVARILLSRRRVRQLVAGGTPLTDASWTTPLMEVADRLDLPELPRLVVNANAAMPLTCGISKPAIVLPPEAAQWTDERRRAVLCHELAHVRRRDLLSHMLGRVACALYWFQPLAWSAARRLRAESERAADDLVLITGTRASSYADHLLQIVTSVKRVAAPVVALPMAQPREFEARLLSILEKDRKREPLPKLHAAALTLLVFAIALPLVALSPTPRPSPIVTYGESQDEDVERPDDPSGVPAPNPVPRANPAPNVQPWVNAQPQVNTQLQSNIQLHANTRQRTSTRELEHAAEQFGESMARYGMNAANSVIQSLLGPGQERDPRVRAALIRALGDSAAEVARTAAWALASHRDTAVVRALTNALRTARHDDVREMAAWALVQQDLNATTIAALSNALTSDRDDEVRTTAAWGLGQTDDNGVVAVLERAVRTDSMSDVRMAAAWALGQHASKSSVAALSEALRYRDDDVRHAAAWALGQIEPQPAPPNLIAALQDSVSEVREVAAWALGRIADPGAAAALRAALSDADTDVRRAAIWAISNMDGDAAIDALTAALNDPDKDVRAAAAAALGGRGGNPWPWPWPWPQPRTSPH